MAHRLYLNTRLLSEGLRKAITHTNGHVLAGPGLLRLVVIHSLDLVTLWERTEDIETDEGIAFVVPHHVAEMLASDILAGVDRLGAAVGPGEVKLGIEGVEPGDDTHTTALHPEEDAEKLSEAEPIEDTSGPDAGNGLQNGSTTTSRKPLFDVPLD